MQSTKRTTKRAVIVCSKVPMRGATMELAGSVDAGKWRVRISSDRQFDTGETFVLLCLESEGPDKEELDKFEELAHVWIEFLTNLARLYPDRNRCPEYGDSQKMGLDH